LNKSPQGIEETWRQRKLNKMNKNTTHWATVLYHKLLKIFFQGDPYANDNIGVEVCD